MRDQLRTFGTATGGNVMMTFALASVPMIGFVGSAVDYSRANSDKAAMQAAIDATGLMLSKDTATISDQKASDYFNAQFHRPDVTNVMVKTAYSSSGGYQIVVTATGTVPTTFMKVMGFSTLDISATSTIKWGNSRLRVALVLDNTGSMSSGSPSKISALQTALTGSNGLLTQLKNAASQNGDVYVSIIPFVKDVAVDPSTNYTQNWVDWTDWLAQPPNMSTWVPANQNSWEQVGPGSNCPLTNSNHGFKCTNQPATNSAATNTTT
ncbi:MAG TPA: pilus assembly protein TadG-related protein, partial [Planctomycetaceae bacterium]|nr:pilus assembly protein TadG-related protein [Planctomycetaceae bacterium]